MPAIARILDANANRAREALRVMEDAARFVLNRADLSQACKSLRHDLAAAIEPCLGLEAARDTPGDVGTALKTPREQSRASLAEVVIAAGKRLGEALRTLEEYAKLLPDSQAGGAALASSLQALRYRGYDLEHRIHLALASTRARQWKLCVLLTRSLCVHHPWQTVLQACLDHGVDCIQIREKDLEAGPLLDHCHDVVQRCRARGVSVIVNDRPDVALLCGADGVHVGQTDLPCREVRKLVGRQLLIGVSTANLDQARAAVEHGADYLGLGPMFATTTKHKEVIVGPDYLRECIAAFPDVPHLAIGGIRPEHARTLRQAGARGLAVSSAVCSSPDPVQAVRQLLCD